MFYVKDDNGMLHEIIGDEVITHCGGCDKEMVIDIAEVEDLYGTVFYCCPLCAEQSRQEGPTDCEKCRAEMISTGADLETACCDEACRRECETLKVPRFRLIRGKGK